MMWKRRLLRRHVAELALYLTFGCVRDALRRSCDAKIGDLHVACAALGLGPGQSLWTSPNTFVASANCARCCGAQVDFVDIDPQTYNMSVEALATKLEMAEEEGSLPRIVVPVHFAGQPCDMKGIRILADRYGFKVLVDASHAVGAEYGGRPVGCGEHADITVFSLHPVKIITTGEGGIAVTNEADLADRMRRLRSHGTTQDPAEMRQKPAGPWSYEQIELGFNYRLTDLSAALGMSQMKRLPAFLSRRRELASRYDTALGGLPLVRPWQHPDGRSAWHLYVVQVDPDAAPIDRATLFEKMRGAQIGVNVHYIPVHTQPYYRDLGFSDGCYPVAERFYSNAITLPLYPGLGQESFDRVVDTLRKNLG